MHTGSSLCYFGVVSEDLNDGSREGRFERERRFTFSAELLRDPTKYGQEMHDKVFCIARLSQAGDTWFVDISPDTPTVALSEKVRNEHGVLRDSPVVSELRKKEKFPQLSLVSGGSFVSIDGAVVLLRRDAGAPVDAGCLTGPAGRSGELLSQTNMHETNEELMIVVTGYTSGQEPKLLTFINRGADSRVVQYVQEKRLAQVRTVEQDLLKRLRLEDAALLHKIRGPNDLKMISIDVSRDDLQGTQEIITRIEGQVVDRVHGFVFFDEQNNTLEVRAMINYALPPGYRVAGVFDGELFGRDAALYPLDKLMNERMVPALRHYVDGRTPHSASRDS